MTPELQMQHERMHRRYDFFEALAPWGGGAVLVGLIGWLIVPQLMPMVSALAGQTTTVQLNAQAVSLLANLGLTVGFTIQVRRGKAKVRTIDELRAKLSVYENQGLARIGVKKRKG